jgi:EAL domain-containing protein (putative c-di-GMP-specific phosphodiesterase class I)
MKRPTQRRRKRPGRSSRSKAESALRTRAPVGAMRVVRPAEFGHASLIQTVREALKRHGLEPGCLTLEVTESTAMRSADASLRILQQLRDMGVSISIDDFGTGYSSLLYLKRLPASELKIDRGFVRDLARDTEDAAIVSAIVAYFPQVEDAI